VTSPLLSEDMPSALITLLLVLFALQAPAAAEGNRHVRAGGHINLVWLHGGDSDSYRTLVEPMHGVSVLSPTWWQLSSTGREIVDEGDPEFVTWAQQRGHAVWPLLSNGDDPERTRAALGGEVSRTRLVHEVLGVLERSGADGVNIDFGNLHPESGPDLTEFVAELNRATSAVVSVGITPITDSWDLGTWSTSYDRPGLGAAANFVVLMAYDQHNALRRDGPVAGLDWVEASVEHLLRYVRADRIILGIPLYARDWVDDPAEPGGVALDATLGMADMAERLAAHEAVAEMDPVAGQQRYTYTDDAGREHRVWQEDAGSLRRRVELVGRYRLAGTAAWRAEFAGPEVWPALDEALDRIAKPEPDRRSGPPRLMDAVPQPDVAPQDRPTPQSAPTAEPAEEPPGALSTGAVAVAAAMAAAALIGLSRLRG
jgi:spore germination protein YaaH